MSAHTSYLGRLIIAVGGIVGTLIPILGGLALLVFFWGLVTFILKDEKKDEGKNRMIWGVVALFVMIMVWGLVHLLAQMVGVDLPASPQSQQDCGLPDQPLCDF